MRAAPAARLCGVRQGAMLRVLQGSASGEGAPRPRLPGGPAAASSFLPGPRLPPPSASPRGSSLRWTPFPGSPPDCFSAFKPQLRFRSLGKVRLTPRLGPGPEASANPLIPRPVRASLHGAPVLSSVPHWLPAGKAASLPAAGSPPRSVPSTARRTGTR